MTDAAAQHPTAVRSRSQTHSAPDAHLPPGSTTIFGPQSVAGAVLQQQISLTAPIGPTVLTNFTPTWCCGNSTCRESILDPDPLYSGHLDTRILRVCSYMWVQDNVYTPTLECFSGLCLVDGANETGGCSVININIYSLGGSRNVCSQPLTYFNFVALCGDGAATCVLRKGTARYELCYGHPGTSDC